MKKMNDSFFKALCYVLLILSFQLAGCAYSPKTTPSEIEPYRFKRLLLLPVKDSSAIYGTDQTVRCGVCGAMYITAEVEAKAGDWMTAQLKSLLDDRTSIIEISEDRYYALRDRLLSTEDAPATERDIWLKIGRDAGADGVISGSVYRFIERAGNDYAVGSPAAVGFELDLIETQNGNIIWSRRYEETQQALSENLFGLAAFLKRKGKWVTVRELATAGMEEILASIPIEK